MALMESLELPRCSVEGCTSRSQWKIVGEGGKETPACSRHAQGVLRAEQKIEQGWKAIKEARG